MSRHVRDLATEEFDTRTLLNNAAEQAIERNYEDFFIVDVDSHHYETEAFKEIAEYIEDPVMRYEAKFQGTSRGGITSENGSYQELDGPHHALSRAQERESAANATSRHHAHGALDGRARRRHGGACFRRRCSISSNCPRIEVEVALATAYNRWLCDTILDKDPRIKSMLYLPFHDPEACYEIVKEFGDRKGVVGFMVTSTHYTRNYENPYMKIYAALQERNLPLGFHAAFTWADQSLQLTNRFIGGAWARLHLVQHAPHGQLAGERHAGALPEAQDGLDRKSGLAWVPFLMQRLDNEFMMRTSDAPLLKRKPSDYMREMYLHLAADGDGRQQEGARGHLRDDERAETQLSTHPTIRTGTWTCRATIYDLPFLDEAKRNILGGNAQTAVQSGAGAVAGEAGAARGAQGGRAAGAAGVAAE